MAAQSPPSLPKIREIREQLRLLPYENPWPRRLGGQFFDTIPKTPGVYTMRDRNGAILYIGKAKNLRARLLSYRRARPDQVSRKVIRLIHLARQIEWELCESEQAALLRENTLLRAHKPPFNVVNIHPESYHFIAVRFADHHAHFRLTLRAEKISPDELIFGAFKGRRSFHGGYYSLLRLLWGCFGEFEEMGFPMRLMRRTPPATLALHLPPLPDTSPRQWERLVRRFLKGTSRTLLVHITERLLQREEVVPIARALIQEDLDATNRFFDAGPRKIQRMKRALGMTRLEIIAQENLDDCLVLYRHRPKKTLPEHLPAHALRIRARTTYFQSLERTSMTQIGDKVSETITNYQKRPLHEGELTKRIEAQTGKVPSLGFLSLAIGSMALSAGLAIFAKNKQHANFVGLWAPSFLLLGIYNKLVKLEGGSDFETKPTRH